MGGIASFHAALAIHALSGRIPNWPESHDAMLTDAFKAGPSENTVSVPIQQSPSRDTPSVQNLETPPTNEEQEELTRLAKEHAIAQIVSRVSGFPTRMIHGSTNLEVIGLNPEKISQIRREIQSKYRVKGTTDGITLPALVEWLDEIPTTVPMTTPLSQEVTSNTHYSTNSRKLDPFVFSGISLGLPGMDDVFAPDTFDRIVRGDNFISEVSDEIKQLAP